MKAFKLFVAAAFFVTSITFDEQILRTSDNILVSKWSLSFGIQNSQAVALYLDPNIAYQFE